jgi:hypothetical protein
MPVLALAGVVQITGVGIDILVLTAAALLLFGLERSLGDLLGEWFGPIASALILVLVVGALFWYFLADTVGRSQTDSFFAEAERRGYRAVFYQPARVPADVPPPSPDSAPGAEPIATGGSSSTSSPASRGLGSAVGVERPASRGTESQARARAPEAPSREKTRLSGSFFRRASPADLVATAVKIDVSPSRPEVARRAVISAAVRSKDTPVTAGAVEFTVNGMGAGRVPLNSDGVASTTFLAHIPGPYEVSVRYTGSAEYASSIARASFNVVARR